MMILLHAFELVYSYFMVKYDEPPSLWFSGGYLHVVCAVRVDDEMIYEEEIEVEDIVSNMM
jgi:hypothetical protein